MLMVRGVMLMLHFIAVETSRSRTVGLLQDGQPTVWFSMACC
jgi:hypothetical protein